MITYSALIVRPADEPIIITGRSHADCLAIAYKYWPNRERSKDTQGFLTDDYHFLDRRDAKFHARHYGQILPGRDSEDVNLYSEDIRM